ncbi:hypothetical protein [Chryseobacterium sp. ISL-6]|uniref:hypothetical protein n=1 Tax=Chryseobacterium sp. ISL-6 TaxID=2819143 RepID=UPI001BEAB9E0|nr:hypothetical protein [Chryseobacterium sp. ISL-6]MBT2623631.1 hypothetical protein [Chryseobacterium sp. ISL-6]
MKILNRALFFSFLICSAIIILLYISLTNEVGNIAMNSKTDNPNFQTKGIITYQYYQASTKYKGERKTIREALINKVPKLATRKKGWIVIRFIVNHQGLTDRFRFFCIDEKYRDAKLSSQEEENLLKLIRPLHNWKIGKVNGEKVDSYYQITFKAENGKVIDIF